MKSIILKNRLKFLYSYSKQSLAPAVSTVGFSFFKKGRIRLVMMLKDFLNGTDNQMKGKHSRYD